MNGVDGCHQLQTCDAMLAWCHVLVRVNCCLCSDAKSDLLQCKQHGRKHLNYEKAKSFQLGREVAHKKDQNKTKA